MVAGELVIVTGDHWKLFSGCLRTQGSICPTMETDLTTNDIGLAVFPWEAPHGVVWYWLKSYTGVTICGTFTSDALSWLEAQMSNLSLAYCGGRKCQTFC
jgi:hypothetical protein